LWIRSDGFGVPPTSRLSIRRVAARLRDPFCGHLLSERTMKATGHPEYKEIHVTCTCGNSFTTRSTLGHDLQVEVCSNCHPFYTGKQKIVDTAGRVDRFRKKYAAAGSPR
jgi:large subunit ribosomal protein L31